MNNNNNKSILLGLGDEITREIIKEKLKDDFSVNIARDDGDIAFVTYNKGDPEAFIRLDLWI